MSSAVAYYKHHHREAANGFWANRDNHNNMSRQHVRRQSRSRSRQMRRRCSSDSMSFSRNKRRKSRSTSRSTSRRRHRSKQRPAPAVPEKRRRRSKSPIHSRKSRSRSSRARSPSPKRDDEGHLVMNSGMTLNGRYRIEKVLGEGTFGRVAECTDLYAPLGGGDSDRPRRVAVKVIKAVDKYREAAKLEVQVLECFNQVDPEGRFLCVRLRDTTDYHGHMCLVFDMLGDSVFDWQKANDYAVYPLDQLRYMAYQLCYATKFLHDCGLTHTDLKPENILFRNSKDYQVRWNGKTGKSERIVSDATIQVIDFGSATWEEEHHTKIVSTRHYRAPEVVLELGWDHLCDVWSIGCIIFELYSGVTLFMTHDNLEHLAMMERAIGHLPSRMVRRSPKQKYFKRDRTDRDRLRLNWNAENEEGRYVRKHVKRLTDYCAEPKSTAHQDLFDLLSGMLQIDPDQRMTLREALSHPFFDELPEALKFHKFRSSSPLGRQMARSRQQLRGLHSRSRSYSRYSYNGRAR